MIEIAAGYFVIALFVVNVVVVIDVVAVAVAVAVVVCYQGHPVEDRWLGNAL